MSCGKLAARIRELVMVHAKLKRIADPVLIVRPALWTAKLHCKVLDRKVLDRKVLAIIRADQSVTQTAEVSRADERETI